MTGWNGVGPGRQHCNDIFPPGTTREDHHEWSIKNEAHAEQNAIDRCARYGISTLGCSIIVTLEPCERCALSIVNAGIIEVVYCEKYDGYTEGIQRLTEANIYTLYTGADTDIPVLYK